MTKAEVKSLVVANIGNRTDKDSVIELYLQTGVKEIGDRHSFKQLRSQSTETIAIDDLSVNLPANTQNLIEARVTSTTNLSTTLQVLSKVQFVEMFPNVEIDPAGMPRFGYIENGELSFAPKADFAYDVVMTVSLLPSVAETGNFLIPIENALVSYVTSKIWLSLGNADLARSWYAEYERELLVATRNDKRSPALKSQSQRAMELEVGLPSSGTPWLDPFVRSSNG